MRLTNTTPQTLMPGETIRRQEKPQPQTPSRPSTSTPPAPAVPAATNRHRPRRPPAPNTRRQLRRLHNLVDDIHKRLPHVLPCQRTDLGEEGAVRLGERAALFRRDLAALGSLVELGADLFVPFSQDLRGRQVSGVRGGGGGIPDAAQCPRWCWFRPRGTTAPWKGTSLGWRCRT